MYLQCSVPFTISYNDTLACTGTPLQLNDLSSLSGHIAICDQSFIDEWNRIKCKGSLFSTNDQSLVPNNHYLLQVDSYNYANNEFYNPNNLTSELVTTPSIPVDPVTPNPSGTTVQQVLTPADYAVLISLALPSLVIAFASNMIYRQILNRN